VGPSFASSSTEHIETSANLVELSKETRQRVCSGDSYGDGTRGGTVDSGRRLWRWLVLRGVNHLWLATASGPAALGPGMHHLVWDEAVSSGAGGELEREWGETTSLA